MITVTARTASEKREGVYAFLTAFPHVAVAQLWASSDDEGHPIVGLCTTELSHAKDVAWLLALRSDVVSVSVRQS